MRAIADKVGGNVTATEKRLVYTPALIGFASVRFTDRKLGLDESLDVTLLQPLGEGNKLVTWKGAQQAKIDPRDVEDKGEPDASFVADLPDAVTNVKAFNALAADLADELSRGQSFTLAYNPALKLYAQPGESRHDFQDPLPAGHTASSVTPRWTSSATNTNRKSTASRIDWSTRSASWRKTKLSIGSRRRGSAVGPIDCGGLPRGIRAAEHQHHAASPRRPANGASRPPLTDIKESEARSRA